MPVLPGVHISELRVWKGSRMKDQYQRTIDYLRVSVTDRCNFRCRYCMPEEGAAPVSHSEILSYEEILRICAAAAKAGIKKVKITGGEPLVRKGVCGLVGALWDIDGIEAVTITTNGALLEQYIPGLVKASVSAINISLDTLDEERFRRITRCGSLDQVQKGFQKAVETGIPVKINCVPMRGFNEDEITGIAALAGRYPVMVRFIEMMPIGMGAGYRAVYQDEIRARLEREYGEMTPVCGTFGNGPATYYEVPGFCGKIGFISALSHEFCGTCNRVRLTADGILKLCLNYQSDVDLKRVIRGGAPDAALEQIFCRAVYKKPGRHGFEAAAGQGGRETRKMSGIGG